MAVVDALRARFAAGETLDRLTENALRWLADPGAVAAEPADPAVALAVLSREWQTLEAAARTAWERYPEYHASGAHGMRPDPRAMELYGTLTYLARAGMYSPGELEALLRDGADQGAWVARECLRLRALLVCLARLIDGLDTGAILPLAYADAVSELAGRFGSATVAIPSS